MYILKSLTVTVFILAASLFGILGVNLAASFVYKHSGVAVCTCLRVDKA